MKGMKNVDFYYTWAGRRNTGNWACERLPEISFSGTPGLREIIPTNEQQIKEVDMISTIVLMGTLVTLLMVQDWQSWWWAGNNIRQNGTNFAKRNWKMMLTILGCAVAVGLVANVVKKTMNWKRKVWKKVKLCWPLWIVCWLRPAWSGRLPGTDENASRLCRDT